MSEKQPSALHTPLKVESTEQSETADAVSTTGKQTETGVKDFTKLNLPSCVELMASEEKSEKRYSGPNSVIKRNVTVAKSIYLSGPQVPQP